MRIDKETKAEMNSIDVNWSEVVRSSIKRRIDEEERRKELRRPSRGEQREEEIIRRP